jgi:sigma-B regulation protein RsbU (phosphoserine phosphatase)
MCTYSIPLFRGSEFDRQFIGVVMIDVGLEDLQDIITKISEEDKRYYLLSATGQYVIASHNELDLAMKETIFTAAEKFGKEDLAKAGRDMLADKSGILAYSRVKDDRRVYIAYTPLPKTGWHLKVAMDEDKVLEPVYAKIYYTIFYFLAEFAVILVVVVVVAGRLAVPIKRLAKFARQLAAGDLESHVGSIRLSKEIDQLAHTFDKMVVDLKSNIEQRIKEESARQAVESELVAARRIQASLMPRIFPPFPERKEFDLHAMNEPVVFIAGDFFDFFFIKPDTLAFVIADVSGHGIPAALFMAVSRTILRTFSTPDRSPHEVMEHVNQLLSTDNDDMMFVTMFYGHYNVATGELTYVNAGHDPPYFVRKDGRLEALQATGPLVATFEGVSYKEQTVQMESGDLLVTFTDGVTEAHSRDNVMYGTERLERLLVEIREESVVEICDRVFRDADSFAGHECQDDVTLLVLRRN